MRQRSRLLTKLKYWLPAAFWSLVIFTLSSLRVHPASQIYWQDFVVKKAAHLVEYSILYLLVYRAMLNTTTVERRNTAILALIIVVIYAISDEYHQSFTPGREPYARDVLIDTLAACLVWFGLWRYLPKAPRILKTLAKNLEVD